MYKEEKSLRFLVERKMKYIRSENVQLELRTGRGKNSSNLILNNINQNKLRNE